LILEKLLNSEGRELRRALFSLKQIFQVGIRGDDPSISLYIQFQYVVMMHTSV